MTSPNLFSEMSKQQVIQYLPVVLVLALVIYRNSRPQIMNEIRFWIPPVLVVLMSAFMFYGIARTEPGAMMYALVTSAIGIVLGIPLGIARGHHSQVRLHDKEGHFIVDPSLVVLLIWLGAFAVRFAIHIFLPTAGDVTLGVSDGLLVFALTSVIVARIVIFRKYLALKSTPA